MTHEERITVSMAELAHWLECDTRTLETASVAQLNRIRKASRIVSELAKVEDNMLNASCTVAMLMRCRAIAKEGAEDERAS